MQKECVQWICSVILCYLYYFLYHAMHSTYLMAFCQNASSEYLLQGYSNKLPSRQPLLAFRHRHEKIPRLNMNAPNSRNCGRCYYKYQTIYENSWCELRIRLPLKRTNMYVERRRAKQVFVYEPTTHSLNRIFYFLCPFLTSFLRIQASFVLLFASLSSIFALD